MSTASTISLNLAFRGFRPFIRMNWNSPYTRTSQIMAEFPISQLTNAKAEARAMRHLYGIPNHRARRKFKAETR